MKKIICTILTCAVITSVFLWGNIDEAKSARATTKNTISEESMQERYLRISVTPHKDAGFITIPLEQGSYKDITYLDVEDVTIDIDGASVKLEDALQEEKIFIEELVAYARKDASLGLCRETAKSQNGLTEFTYYYEEFALHYVYDIYETPDGKQHLIADFLIYGPWCEPHFLYSYDEAGVPIDYEDWGLRFEVSELDTSGITITCFQSGGQQLGRLNVGVPMLSRKNPDTLVFEQVQPLTEEGELTPFTGIESWNPDPEGFLTMGGTTELIFDFAYLYGDLVAGDYVLSLQVVDCYHEDEVPPLTRNYYDQQWYDIEFTLKDNN